MRTLAIGGALAVLHISSCCLAPVEPDLSDGGDAGTAPHGCAGKVCSKAEVCDPIDGLCKCGPQLSADGGVGWAVCGPSETCDLNLMVCVGSLCDAKICSNGNICDIADGICKCGGVVCLDSQTCDTTSHLCQ